MRKDDGFHEAAVAVDVVGGNQAFALGTRALFIGGTGAVAAEMWDGGTVTFTGLPAGAYLPVRVRTVLQTGTTATGVIALL